MKPIVLTKAEVQDRGGVFPRRDWSDGCLAEDTLWDLRLLALFEARRATEARREWPEWVSVVLVYRAELMERRAVRRELRSMAVAS